MVSKPVKILVASASRIFLEGICKFLDDETDIEKAIEATNQEEIKDNIKEFKPEYILIDNRMLRIDIPKLLNSIIHNYPHTKIILLSDHDADAADSPNLVHITKHTNYSDLMNIIKVENVARGSGQAGMPDAKHKLTDRELDVVKLVAAGFNNKKIASRLSISEKTVKAHITNIFTKLDLKNRYQIIVYGNKLKNR